MKRITAFLCLFVLLFALNPLAQEGAISYACKYTLVTPASSAYSDNGTKLTDGIFGTLPDGAGGYYTSPAYIGFNQADADENGNFVIILDLGREYSDINAVTIGYLNETSVGIFAPRTVSFELSVERNGEYSLLGILETEKPTELGLSETFASTLACDDASGRYLRVTIEHLGEYLDAVGELHSAGWTFIDEIAVFSSGNSAGNESSAESAPESAPEQSSTSPISSAAPTESVPEPITPGDTTGGIVGFVLLALSAITMMAALLISRKNSLSDSAF